MADQEEVQTGTPEAVEGGAISPPEQSGTPSPSTAEGEKPKEESREEETKVEEPKTFRRTLRIKGEDVDSEATEDELWAAYRRQAASTRSLQEAAQAAKEAQATQKIAQEQIGQAQLVFQALREPQTAIAALMYMGINPYQFAAGIMGGPPADPALYQQWEMQMSGIYQRMKAMEETNTQAVSAAEQESQAKELTYHLDQMGRLFEGAMKKFDIPKSDWTMALMAAAYKENIDNNYELSEDELVSYVIETVTEQQKFLFSRLSGEQILKRFPDAAKKIYQAGLDRYKSRQPKPVAAAPVKDIEPPRINSQKKLMSDKEIDALLGIR